MMNQKSIVFITGVPGAGKTLIGLNLASELHNSSSGEHAVFLSGNLPLVTVLQEALARDKVQREHEAGNKVSKAEAKREVKSFIQIIHHYRDEYVGNDRKPTEHISIFDESQRSWTEEELTSFMEKKKGIAERYPNTELKGDGQIVSIEFSKYTIELVPGFKQKDNTFKYPDSNEGGKWKITNPLAEQEECNFIAKKKTVYLDVCRLIRKWKNNKGFRFKGLLIDTLTHDCLLNDLKSSSLLESLLATIEYCSKQDRNQSYWYALGSNQKIYNDDRGSFVIKAQKAFNMINKCNNDEELNDVLSDLLGRGYPSQTKASWTEKLQLRVNELTDTEEFIEDYVPVDIRYYLKIDCEVEQKGFRPFLLSTFLNDKRGLLKIKKNLEFYISKTNCPEPYSVYWKVKNVGNKAIERNDIRGQILKTNKRKHSEKTRFFGPHYVECYLIKNNVCVARDRISVPIGDEE